jgi:hypothetical protein
MEARVIVRSGNKKYIEVRTCTLRDEKAVTDLIGFCAEHDSNCILLSAGNLGKEFFDLKSGQAGMMLQKFSNYHLKVALVVSEEYLKGRFAELALEANRGRQFHIFHDTMTAEQWLFRAD